ncbi:MAG: hypothetical protein AAFV53_23480, partial [Myxococcota bacterium]
GGFSASLHELGLGWMPSSVSAKSNIVTSQGSVAAVLGNLRHNLGEQQGLVLLCVLLIVVARTVSTPLPPAERWVGAAMSASIVLHMCFGQFGWFNRYELYILTPAFLVALVLVRAPLTAALRTPRALLVGAMVTMILTFAGLPYWIGHLTSPLAAYNVYQQQYQMHRFVTEHYQGPVAVNDLGWVAYRNDQHVLDFWGLGSREALDLRRASTDTGWMNALADRHDVQVVIIYERWFGPLPPEWHRVGVLILDGPRISLGDSVVSFFARDDATRDQVIPLLEQFRDTLPPGVQLGVAER